MVNKTSYDQLEESIVAQLKPLVNAGIEVFQTIETDAEQNDIGIAFEKPRITIMYLMSEFDDQPIKGLPKNYTIGVVNQREFAEVTINIQCRKLRGALGLYSIYEDCRKLLLGFQPKGWGRIFLKNFILVERNDETNVWYYALTIVSQREIFSCANADNLNLTNSTNTGMIEVEPENPNLVEVNLNVKTSTDA